MVTKIEKHKAPVASSFGQKTPITDSKVSEATLEEVRNPVEGVEEPVATVVHEIAPTVAPLSATPSAGKKYQRLEIVQAHVLGSRIPQEEVKRKKSKKNGQLGGKERVKSVDPIGIKAPSYFGGRKGIERFAYEHLADLNKLDYDYSKQTMAIELTINASGKIANIEVVDKVHPAIDQAAIDIFRAMPKWEEGNTDIVYTVALTFN